ncbi:MAG TPA: hypothetical protein ENJ75_01540 [Candidatus Kaiserbacteria bacterium]|nr:hypothetical protein [Candidatus Kaiserbacteria bacterium]
MNISDISEVSKRLVATFRHEGISGVAFHIPRDVLVVVLLLLATATGFGMGVLFEQQAGQRSVIIETLPLSTSTVMVKRNQKTALPVGGQVVASSKGTKYYFPWCGGAKYLSKATRIWFASAKKARDSGYAPASSCKGLR